ncbi:DUF6468 domain-containing protein [Roseibium litorale]|uniref:Chemotaxis protein n=1 Tax=Roseibium litorale TaxID=2803841 RepID=A0ABR9CJD2_9HYPH|nr:DUF6468 domain-containing protein [Roseibium litorale]MBD8890412.1 chemotaxis protein [Roseibium litorale]
MSLPLGMIIEGLVAVLLVVTIGYCWLLNHRLQRLRADEETLRATISELMTATEIAERAILGLKATASEADRSLGARLQDAEKLSHELAEQVGEGERIFHRISQIAETVRGATAQRDAAAHEAAAHAAMMAQRQVYQQPVPQSAQGYEQQAYGAAPHVQVQSVAAPAAAPQVRKRGLSTDDIRSAAAEATARLERFRKRSEGAAA